MIIEKYLYILIEEFYKKNKINLGINQEFTCLFSRKERELTNRCEFLPIHHISSISLPKITMKCINHINE